MKGVSIPAEGYAIRVPADIYAKNIDVGERGCSWMLTFNKRFRLEIDMHLSGVFNVYNGMTAAALCDSVGVSPEAIKAGLESVKNVPGRIELLDY